MFNYDENVTIDDGSCVPYVYGCTDFLACNYDAIATCDDGSCVFNTFYMDSDGDGYGDEDDSEEDDDSVIGGDLDSDDMEEGEEEIEDLNMPYAISKR